MFEFILYAAYFKTFKTAYYDSQKVNKQIIKSAEV